MSKYNDKMKVHKHTRISVSNKGFRVEDNGIQTNKFTIIDSNDIGPSIDIRKESLADLIDTLIEYQNQLD